MFGILLASVAIFAQGAMGSCVEHNMDYNGNDIIYFEDAEITRTWALCLEKCNAESKCTHWTWFKQNYPGEALRGKCLLKTGMGVRREVDWGISGAKGCSISVRHFELINQIQRSSFNEEKKDTLMAAISTISDIEKHDDSLTEKQQEILKRTHVIFDALSSFYQKLRTLPVFSQERRKRQTTTKNERNFEDSVENMMKETALEIKQKLISANQFLEEGRSRPSCIDNPNNMLEEVEALVKNLENQLETSASEEIRMQHDFLEGIKDFGDLGILKVNFEEGGKRRCDAIWGKRWVDESGDFRFIARSTDAEKVADCEQPCQDRQPCSKWTYNQKEKICYLHSDDTAFQLSQSFDSDDWSSALETCINKKRVCFIPKLTNCINMIHDRIANEKMKNSGLVELRTECRTAGGEKCLQLISDDQRTKFDTVGEEMSCFDEFCPWDVDWEELNKMGNVKLEKHLKMTAALLEHIDHANHTQYIKLKNDEKCIGENCDLKLVDVRELLKSKSFRGVDQSLMDDVIFGQLTFDEKALIMFDLKIEVEFKVVDLFEVTIGAQQPFYVPFKDTSTEIKESPIANLPLVASGIKERQYGQIMNLAKENKVEQALAELVNSKYLSVTDKEKLKKIVLADTGGVRDKDGLTKRDLLINQAGAELMELKKDNNLRRKKNEEEKMMLEKKIEENRQISLKNKLTRTEYMVEVSSKRKKLMNFVRKKAHGFGKLTRISQGFDSAQESLKKMSIAADGGSASTGSQKAGKVEGLGNAISNSVRSVAFGISKIQSGDTLTAVSGVIGLVSTVAGFMGPYGAAFSAVLGIVDTVLTLFGAGGKSQTQIIGEMMEDQTEFLNDKINEQTRIMIAYFEEIAALQVRLSKDILREIKVTKFNGMIDDTKGVLYALKVKKEHLLEYEKSCINSWSEISVESDMEAVNTQMGRLGSYMRRFCASLPNLAFCGELILNYALLATLRNSVRMETINVVRRSRYHNQQFKIKGLIAEHNSAIHQDKILFEHLIRNTQSDTCHVACTLYNVVNPVAKGDETFDLGGICRLDEKKKFRCALEKTVPGANGLRTFILDYEKPGISLSPSQRNFIMDYIESIGLPRHLSGDPDLDTKDCKKCYLRNPCKDANHKNKGKKCGDNDKYWFERDQKTNQCVKCKKPPPKPKKKCAWYEGESRDVRYYAYDGDEDKQSWQYWEYMNVYDGCSLELFQEKKFRGETWTVDDEWNGSWTFLYINFYDDWMGKNFANDIRSYKCHC